MKLTLFSLLDYVMVMRVLLEWTRSLRQKKDIRDITFYVHLSQYQNLRPRVITSYFFLIARPRRGSGSIFRITIILEAMLLLVLMKVRISLL